MKFNALHSSLAKQPMRQVTVGGFFFFLFFLLSLSFKKVLRRSFSTSRKTDTCVDRLSAFIHKFIHVSPAFWSLPTGTCHPDLERLLMGGEGRVHPVGVAHWAVSGSGSSNRAKWGLFWLQSQSAAISFLESSIKRKKNQPSKIIPHSSSRLTLSWNSQW